VRRIDGLVRAGDVRGARKAVEALAAAYPDYALGRDLLARLDAPPAREGAR